MTKKIPLTKGKFAIVDDEDYERVMKHKWTAINPNRSKWYAVTNLGRKHGNQGKQKKVYLHRMLTDALPGQEVDHANSDGLDNRRVNLRLCSRSQNSQNGTISRSSTSGFKGVCWAKLRGKWVVNIKLNGKQICLGYFSNKEDAARAYDDGARKYFGEFAKTNF